MNNFTFGNARYWYYETISGGAGRWHGGNGGVKTLGHIGQAEAMGNPIY